MLRQRGGYGCALSFEGSGNEILMIVTIEQKDQSTWYKTEIRVPLRFDQVAKRAETVREPAEEPVEDDAEDQQIEDPLWDY